MFEQDVGEPQKVVLSHESRDPADAWRIDYVTVADSALGLSAFDADDGVFADDVGAVYFANDKWFDVAHTPGAVASFELARIPRLSIGKRTDWTVRVKTGCAKGSGTDGRVKVHFIYSAVKHDERFESFSLDRSRSASSSVGPSMQRAPTTMKPFQAGQVLLH